MQLTIQSALPGAAIVPFVHSFWLLENNTGKDLPATLLPNGMVDMSVKKVNEDDWVISVRGLDTISGETTIPAGFKMFSIGFKLLAVEYLFQHSIGEMLNGGKEISNDFWQFEKWDMDNLESFSDRATQKIQSISKNNIDDRKQQLFSLIYDSNGSINVKELSEKVYWSSRQINRYFNQQFGISLKAYCSILRFGASFKQISEGRLFPEQAFTDQNHFIKEIKKYAGVTPKELSKNKDERFIDITAIKKMPFQNG